MVLKCGISNIHENFFVTNIYLFQSFAFRRIFFRYNSTVFWLVLNETSICELGHTESVTLGLTVPSLDSAVINSGGEPCGSRCMSSRVFPSSLDWRKLRTRSPKRNLPHSLCRRSSFSLSCRLYFKYVKGICCYSNVYEGTWMQTDIIFRVQQVGEGGG